MAKSISMITCDIFLLTFIILLSLSQLALDIGMTITMSKAGAEMKLISRR